MPLPEERIRTGAKSETEGLCSLGRPPPALSARRNMPKSVSDPICVVDDDPSVQKALSRLLSLEGWEVRSFKSGEQFVAYASKHGVPLVILDLSMPGLSGLQVQAMINEISPKPRVIIVTARDDDSLRSAAMKGGAADFFLKPFDDEKLLRAMHCALDT
ncbi:MAG: response regulator [Terrimicrobiaceae bacterium]